MSRWEKQVATVQNIRDEEDKIPLKRPANLGDLNCPEYIKVAAGIEWGEHPQEIV